MNFPPLSGKWEEERLLLWRLVEELWDRLEEEREIRKKQSDSAHEKIREMASLKWKMWAAVIPAVALIVVELLRLLFARH